MMQNTKIHSERVFHPEDIPDRELKGFMFDLLTHLKLECHESEASKSWDHHLGHHFIVKCPQQYCTHHMEVKRGDYED